MLQDLKLFFGPGDGVQGLEQAKHTSYHCTAPSVLQSLKLRVAYRNNSKVAHSVSPSYRYLDPTTEWKENVLWISHTWMGTDSASYWLYDLGNFP
jgi:hypothetical protein